MPMIRLATACITITGVSRFVYTTSAYAKEPYIGVTIGAVSIGVVNGSVPTGVVTAGVVICGVVTIGVVGIGVVAAGVAGVGAVPQADKANVRIAKAAHKSFFIVIFPFFPVFARLFL